MTNKAPAMKWYKETSDKYGPQCYGVPECEYDTSLAIATLAPLYSMTQCTNGARPPSEWLLRVHGKKCGTYLTLTQAKAAAKEALANSSNNPTVIA